MSIKIIFDDNGKEKNLVTEYKNLNNKITAVKGNTDLRYHELNDRITDLEQAVEEAKDKELEVRTGVWQGLANLFGHKTEKKSRITETDITIDEQ